MPDKFSKEVRSEIMSKIRSTGTKLETAVMDSLEERGLPFERNDKLLFGVPDISFREIKTVVFIDSCFWHGCPEHYKRPQSNHEYWDKKYKRNTSRDIKVNEWYDKYGWGIMRVWEHELKEDFESVIEEIVEFVDECRRVAEREDDSHMLLTKKSIREMSIEELLERLNENTVYNTTIGSKSSAENISRLQEEIKSRVNGERA
jgi:DNA mismatch endonuclease, patch repair protein